MGKNKNYLRYEKNRIKLLLSGEIFIESGRLDITMTTPVRAEGLQTVWYTKVENHSPYPVEDL